jgi:very-short-patch-repair endonuclease
MRNRLLNYRPTAARSIRVTGELPSEIYDSLVLREKTLQFRGTGSRVRGTSGALGEDLPVATETIRQSPEEWRPLAESDLAQSHTDRFLETPYDDESLGKKLFRVYHEGHSAVEEQGYTVVHLAVTFLEWYEEDASIQPRLAPLILIPVELERVRAGDFSKVKWTGEDVFANISLLAKLQEQGVALPVFEPPEEKQAINKWLQQVTEAIANKHRWRVLSEMSLDFFSFTKFVMFKDLDPASWPAEKKADDHPLLQTLFNPQGVSGDDEGFDERDIDYKLSARDLWHVRDADPSQIAVIEDVKAGRNLVVQGPPGTGKSQTITNLVAEALAAGKKVLFVSEKMAALEVVKSRLDEAGLGPFCLELHSRKANKKALATELMRALQSKPPSPASEQMLDEHELLKRELNKYAADLGTTVGLLQRTAFQLFGDKQTALSHFDAEKRDVPTLPLLPNAARLTEADVAEATKAIRDLAATMPMVRPVLAHPWRHSTLDTMLPYEEEELRISLGVVLSALHEVESAAADLTFVSGAQQPSRLEDVDRAICAAEILAKGASNLEMNLLLSSEWNGPNHQADSLIRRIEAIQRERIELSLTYTDAAIDRDVSRDFEEFRPLAAKLFRIFNSRYRGLRKRLGTDYRTELPKTAQMVRDLDRLVQHQRAREALRTDATGSRLFGAKWKADVSDCDELTVFSEWIVCFRRELLSNALTERAVELAASHVDPSLVRTRIDRLGVAAATLKDNLDALTRRTRLDVNAAFGEPFTHLSFQQLAAVMGLWQHKTSDLFRWAQFNAARKTVALTAAAPLERLVLADHLNQGDMLPLFRAALAESLLRVAFVTHPTLAGFVGELHERKIARFREIDADLVRLNRIRLSRRLHDQRPLISGGASRNSEAGILLGEFNRRRAHMPIRKLLSSAGGLIQRIKPCFLMSPLSVAQFLDPRSAWFDLIIFDEASQVRPEDAIGALLRGKQLVVMGDTQQLPPTSFFDSLTESDEQEVESDEPQSASVTDVESILHQCARSYPGKMLNWHYRSRHESLIAVSNLHFYENRLHVYPSAIDWAEEIGLHFVHLPKSIYDRGKSSTNHIEAQAVAAAAVEHYRKFPGKSLGVGTFNIKQQQLVLEEIELQLKANPEMEPFFKSDQREHFFVKNLETIQGDERDVIMISIGYGRDASGRLSLNFGPVNREGGERRLNVLMSRAREKCVVFSNFTASDLAIEPSAGKGLITLKTFLEYAEKRRLISEVVPLADTDSPFEDAVAEVLRSEGHEVRAQVGCAGFRVDLAVVDPQERGCYLLGIECDGAKYHSSPVARDRDRLRQQILENLGWTIHRIWSTDWYRNRTETIERLLQAVAVAQSAPRKDVRSESQADVPYESAFTADEYEEEYAVYAYTPTEIEPSNDLSGQAGSQIQIETHVSAFSAEDHSRSIAISRFGDIPRYESCKSLRIEIKGELHLVAPEHLAVAVEDVVRVEGPVHIDEVVRRIRTFWGLQRAGNRIREAIERGVQITIALGVIIRTDGDFLRLPNAVTPLRHRRDDPPPRIELISGEEIAESVKHVLRVQFATGRSDLITAAARSLGIQATGVQVAERIGDVVRGMTTEGVLTVRLDGALALQESVS